MRPRRKREDLRPYVPAPFLQPPLDDLIEEGVLIALSGIRMAVKNRAIVRAIRDAADFDLDWYLGTVRAQLKRLAAETDDDARRVELGKHPQLGESERVTLRRSMLSGLAARLRELATDDEFVHGVAMDSRDRALEEMGEAIASSAHRAIAPSETVIGADREMALQWLYSDLEQLAN